MILNVALVPLANWRRAWRMIALVAFAATGGCFATRNDVRIVQTDVASLRTELLRNDAAQRDALAQALKLMAVANDSLVRIGARTVGTQGDVRTEMRAVKDQLEQVKQLIQQLQTALNRTRSDLEERANAVPVTPPSAVAPLPAGATTAGTSAKGMPAGAIPPTVIDTQPPRGPGAAQLYDNGMAQIRRGSTSTARILFQELLSTYPGSDLAPSAQLQIAASLMLEKNVAGADVGYAAVVAKYPDSPQAPQALYKRAQIALSAGNTADAKRLLNEVISRYPKSLEAEPAAEQLKTIR